MPVSNKAPPHGLDLVIDFVNTRELDEHTDALATPAELRAWLAEKGLLDGRAGAVSDADVAAAIDLREALRALMLANNAAGAQDPSAWGVLDEVCRRGHLAVRFQVGGAALEAGAAGVPGALARLLAPVAAALADGSWQRVKACRADDCLWAFYDRSRNRSGVWCEMAVCGNRTKVRAYRSRAAGGRG